MPRLAPIALAALLLSSPAPAFAAEGPVDQQGVGLYVSNIAGSGLTYSRELRSGWGFHTSVVGWAPPGGASFVNGGAAVTRELDRRPWGRIYGLVGAGFALSAAP